MTSAWSLARSVHWKMTLGEKSLAAPETRIKVNMVLNVHRNRKAYEGRGEGGRGDIAVGEEGERDIYLSLHCHYQNDSCIKMGSDESHFNVSVESDGQRHKAVSTNHKFFEEKGEPKRC